eukprot:TRINITY_DN963_c0_g1_i1.p1 TRINITY_DN963_c0_g1~~TRINITY_DN963_c0_g1_i1.p1  ORF type:complete len:446 (+),score=138.70 TRINITY_DN963_c0_g1_i1:71-1339(+)
MASRYRVARSPDAAPHGPYGGSPQSSSLSPQAVGSPGGQYRPSEAWAKDRSPLKVWAGGEGAVRGESSGRWEASPPRGETFRPDFSRVSNSKSPPGALQTPPPPKAHEVYGRRVPSVPTSVYRSNDEWYSEYTLAEGGEEVVAMQRDPRYKQQWIEAHTARRLREQQDVRTHLLNERIDELRLERSARHPLDVGENAFVVTAPYLEKTDHEEHLLSQPAPPPPGQEQAPVLTGREPAGGSLVHQGDEDGYQSSDAEDDIHYHHKMMVLRERMAYQRQESPALYPGLLAKVMGSAMPRHHYEHFRREQIEIERSCGVVPEYAAECAAKLRREKKERQAHAAALAASTIVCPVEGCGQRFLSKADVEPHLKAVHPVYYQELLAREAAAKEKKEKEEKKKKEKKAKEAKKKKEAAKKAKKSPKKN